MQLNYDDMELDSNTLLGLLGETICRVLCLFVIQVAHIL